MSELIFGSKKHEELYYLLKEVNPGHIIYTEYSCRDLYMKFMPEIDGYMFHRTKLLKLDIFDYTFKIAFEIQGEQHYKYNKFFHKDVSGFYKQLNNDEAKKGLCDSCDVKLIYVNHNDELNVDKVVSFYYE